MNLDQLKQGLEQAFHKEGHRIVFWYDPEADFKEDFDSIGLAGVRVINMSGESSLALKIKLELEDTTGQYLLYFPFSEPDIEKDWLLDIKLYSRCFYADRFSIIFNDLGLYQQSLREHLGKREQFLASKTRLNNLKKWVQPDFDESELDLGMIASVVKAESCDLPHVLFALAEEMVAGDLGLEQSPPLLIELEKYGLVIPLIRALQVEVGYPASVAELNGEASFQLGHFFIRLLTTGFCESVGDIPPWAQDLAIASGSARATSRALLSRWRDSSRYYKAFDGISDWVGEALRIQEKLRAFELGALAEVATFQAVERQIVVDIAQAIPDAASNELLERSEIITHRLDNYWASRHKDDDTRKKYRLIYTALSAAIELFSLRHQHASGFHYSTTLDCYKAYEAELYKFDMAYRHYNEASYRVHFELLKALDASVEQCYSHWFIDNLAKNWGDNVEAEAKLKDWRLPEVDNQYNFYSRQVEAAFPKKKNARVVVIISDAFRYEAAVELTERINQKRYSEAKLISQLGVVPSYTSLGMAALLPHKTLEYRENIGDDVFVDGLSTKSTAARNKVLAAHGGIAVTAEDVKTWSRDQGRAALKDQQLVYVYHNVVDARGDTATTEKETFLAVEQAIEELTELTRIILMNFNTSTVLVTADHGFLFQQRKLDASDRTSLEEKPVNTLKNKKRYVIGFDLPKPKDAWMGSTADTACTSISPRFWIPKGANRFHFVGGARFVHGGVMPQEIVVPVITVKQLRGENAVKRTKRKVGVISAKTALKMVSSVQRFDLMQTETVTDQVLPVTIAAAIYDGDKIVSSEEVLTFDCVTDLMSERVKQVKLSLSGSNFDRKKDYFLILKDKDLSTEVERYRMTIDLAFTDDFY